MRHGRSGYDRHGCRCLICRAANTAHCARVRARRLARMTADPHDPAHGKTNGYNAGCRCDACRMRRHVRYEVEQGRRRHRWREAVTEAYRAAREAWEQTREHLTLGYLVGRDGRISDEYRDFLDNHPPPTLRSVLVGMSGGAWP